VESNLQTAEASSIDAIVERAVEVIGDREDAMRWLGTPVAALNYATPISTMSQPGGKLQVIIVLARLEHGLM
jgi:uncharacterized protein (DUF2384 family)